jgi:hypothetical protein
MWGRGGRVRPEVEVSEVGVEVFEEVGVLGEVERREAAMVRRMWDSVERVARVTHAVRYIC